MVDVTRVEDISEQPTVAREMALIRVATNADNRSEIVQLVNIYRGEIVDVTLDSMIVQIVGSEDRVDSLIDLLATSASSRWCAPAQWPWRAVRAVAPIAAALRSGARRPTARTPRRWSASHRRRVRLRDWRSSFTQQETRQPSHETGIIMAKIYYENQADLEQFAGQEDCDSRLRQPGPRPCTQPQGERHGRARRPLSRQQELGQGGRPTACAC
jgi:hypothetical protein